MKMQVPTIHIIFACGKTLSNTTRNLGLTLWSRVIKDQQSVYSSFHTVTTVMRKTEDKLHNFQSPLYKISVKMTYTNYFLKKCN